ncbi:extracellular solute-binding protein [Paenibacillus sp. 2TAB19]|uniref:extracellular solute-binding protein n=1 Tax=Paenibacillus sp. 2TAB19 TaxID=3233003 RepID=UPI003F986489
MMKMRKKSGILLLVVVLLVSLLAACSNKADNDGKKTQTSEQSGNGSDAPSGEEEVGDPFGRYEEPVEITFAGYIDDTMQKNLLVDGLSYEDNQWTKIIEERLNIKVKYKWISKTGEQSAQKMNLALASGDIPDILLLDPVQLSQAARADILADISPYMEQYMSTEVKGLVSRIGESAKQAATFDGKVLGFPSTNDLAPETGFLWLRSDWLKKLNLELPKSWADVKAISKAFATQDPDGNGKNDTFGLSLSNDYNTIEGVMNGFHANTKIWVEKDGKLEFGGIQPEAKAALAELADMYKAGEIDKEFGLKGGDKIAEGVANQQIGMTYGPFYLSLHPLGEALKSNPDADWTAVLIPSIDEKPVMSTFTLGYGSFFTVRKGFEHPEALIKLLNLYYKMYTEDYAQYGVSGNGKENWRLSPVEIRDVSKNVNTYLAIKDAIASGDTSKLIGEQKAMFDNVDKFLKGDASMWGWYKVFGENSTEAGIKQLMDNKQYVQDKFVGSPTKTMITTMTTLNKLREETFYKIIMGNSPTDEFESFVQSWKKLGGEQITKEVNEWYDGVK